MTPARLVAQGFRAMMRYKLRTSFMMLGSLVGVAALSFVMSVGAAARTKMLAPISQIVSAAATGLLRVTNSSADASATSPKR